ncbi:MAG: fibrobacter succinogenes major paralogous domain-containing protein [Alistipes sp.]|nr:fibrobacter succinogenes major paralogous domain-containing protein [Alistipes senegalensis]MCM1249820.1 fibrobacter succinogenes major paralogous domain-containing protein [Alistipes sp.]
MNSEQSFFAILGIIPIHYSLDKVSFSVSIPAIAPHGLRLTSGNRGNTSGALNNVGAQGLCWSSSPASGSGNAGGLNFNSTYVGPVPDHNRANAFPVRCVQHLRGLFFIDSILTI